MCHVYLRLMQDAIIIFIASARVKTTMEMTINQGSGPIRQSQHASSH